MHNTTHGTLLVPKMCMKLVIYSSWTRGFDSWIFIVKTVNSVESFARSRSWFWVAGGRPGEHLVDIGGDSPASYPDGDMEVHHFQGWWTRTSDFWRNDKGKWFCGLQVCGIGQATWFSFLLALSHVCKVSFVCSLTLMHEFRGAYALWVLFALSCVLWVSFVCSLALMHVVRGSLWLLRSFALLLVVSSPFYLPSSSQSFVRFVCGSSIDVEFP
jgi:hypothetical protein